MFAAIIAATAPTYPEAAAGPFTDSAAFLATNVEGAGAHLALNSGRFVEDAATGVIDVVDRAGQITEQLVPQVLVDGVLSEVKFTIRHAGTELSAVVVRGLTEGAKVTATGVKRLGAAADACFEKGLPAAVLPALIAAITGGLAAVATLNPIGIVTAAALAGLAGAWSGFTDGCTRGAQESWEQTQVTIVHRLDQIAL